MAISFVIFTGTLSTLTAIHAAVLLELTALPNYPGVIKILYVTGTKHSFTLCFGFHVRWLQMRTYWWAGWRWSPSLCGNMVQLVLECFFFSKGVHTSSISCFIGSWTVRELGLSSCWFPADKIRDLSGGSGCPVRDILLFVHNLYYLKQLLLTRSHLSFLLNI